MDKNLCEQTFEKPDWNSSYCESFCHFLLSATSYALTVCALCTFISEQSLYFKASFIVLCDRSLCVCVWQFRVCILSSVCHTDTHRESKFSNLSFKPSEKYLSKSRTPLSVVTVS